MSGDGSGIDGDGHHEGVERSSINGVAADGAVPPASARPALRDRHQRGWR